MGHTLYSPSSETSSFSQQGRAPAAAEGEGDPEELGRSRQSHTLGLGHLRHRAEICNQRGQCTYKTKTTSKRKTRHQQVEIPQLDL